MENDNSDIMMVNNEPYSKMLTKEEFEKATAGSLLHKEPVELTLVKDSEYSIEVWKTIMKSFKDSKIPINPEVFKKAKQWKGRAHKYVAMLNSVESKNLECIALVSRYSEKNPFFINLIVTINPVMTQPYIEIMVNCLERIAVEYKSTLMIPKIYRNVLDNVFTSRNDVDEFETELIEATL